MSGLKFKYGSHVHPAGEVYPQIIEARPVFSDRGIRWATDYRMSVAGSFCADPGEPLDAAGVDEKIAELDSAYLEDYKDFGFLFPDDSPTEHYLATNATNNLSGNRVISRSWDHRSPAEFANTRSFSITLGARLLESYSSILYFHETVSQRGTGGPRWTYRERWSGTPIREDITEKTPVELIQRGIVVGTTSSIAPPGPWWPDDELQEFRLIVRESPRIHGHLSFSRATHYVTRYTYRFLRATTPNQAPNVWWS